MLAESSNHARVIADHGAAYIVDDGRSPRRVTARRCDPVVGDWVVVDGDRITEVLPRRSVFSRRAAGKETREQVLASNVDVAFVVAAANDINLRRIERYLAIAWQSGAMPAVVITKSDLVERPQAISFGAPLVLTSCVTREGVDELGAMLQPAKTGVMLGPSGVGKSSLINLLAGAEVMRTRETHRSGQGRHMTSHRQLVTLGSGGMIIDTPGLREAQLWHGDDALGDVFADIEELSLRCRFNDCSHRVEPGCAVVASVDPARLESYRKLQRELLAVASKSDARLRQDERRKWRQIAVANRARERYLRR